LSLYAGLEHRRSDEVKEEEWRSDRYLQLTSLKPWDAIHRPEVGLHYNRRMQMNEIIAALDSEIARLEQAKNLLAGATYKSGPGGSGGKAPVITKKRAFSPEALARMAAAQKARWAKAKRQAK
jgi:hypothetical protein